MSKNVNDLALSKLFKHLPVADWKKREKITSDFNAYLKKHHFNNGLNELLIIVYNSLCNYRKEEKKSANEYASQLSGLLKHDYPRVASLLFSECYDSVKYLPEDKIIEIIPTAKDVALWVKRASVNKKELAGKVAANPQSYYDSVLFDWASKTLPVSKLVPLVAVILGRSDRCEHLENLDELMRGVLARDKGGTISREILKLACSSIDTIELLVSHVSARQVTWHGWSEVFAEYLVDPAIPNGDSMLMSGIDEYFIGNKKQASIFSTRFPAHLLATISINQKYQKYADDERINNIIKRLVLVSMRGIDNDKYPLWVSGPKNIISEVLMGSASLITLHGANRIAQGLRALEGNPDAGAVFTAVAMNLGIERMGAEGQNIEYDPRSHEDVTGGLLPGEYVKVIRVGWVYAGDVLLRAQVQKE